MVEYNREAVDSMVATSNLRKNIASERDSLTLGVPVPLVAENLQNIADDHGVEISEVKSGFAIKVSDPKWQSQITAVSALL